MSLLKNNFLSIPILWLLRQVYRVFFVWPFQLAVMVASLFCPSVPSTDKEPSSYCFIITSVIYPKQGKQIQNNSPRSIFSPEERAQQTLRTVESIRVKVPGVKIILVESGLREILPFELEKKVDQYIYVGNKKPVRWSCDSKQKSLGEIIMLYYAMKKFKFTADFYFKISGRYFLNEEFNLNDWKRGEFVLQYIKEDYICTRLYGFRQSAFATWKYALLKGIPLTMIAYPIENTLAKYIPRKRVYRLAKLGVSGVGAVTNDIIKD